MPYLSCSRLCKAAALVFVSVLLAVTGAAAQQNQPENLTQDRIAWSPDGRKLAFGATWNGDEEIYIINVDGSDVTQVTDNDRTDTSIIFSADGASVIYVSEIQRDENSKDFDIYTVDINGGEPRLLYGEEGRSEQWPLLMADGRLSVSVRIAPGVINIIAVDLSSGITETLIDSGARDGWGSFSRDGRKLAYSSNRLGGGWKFDIFLANADGSNDRHLALYPLGRDGFGSVYPDFFPDSERFVYRSDKDGNEPGDNHHYICDLKSAHDEPLPRPDGAVLGQPTISPDGKTIAFSADYNGDGVFVISLMDVRTKQVRYLNITPPQN